MNVAFGLTGMLIISIKEFYIVIFWNNGIIFNYASIETVFYQSLIKSLKKKFIYAKFTHFFKLLGSTNRKKKKKSVTQRLWGTTLYWGGYGQKWRWSYPELQMRLCEGWDGKAAVWGWGGRLRWERWGMRAEFKKLRAEVWGWGARCGMGRLAVCERSLDYPSTGKSQHIGSCLIVKSPQDAQKISLSVPQTPDSSESLKAPLESP